MKSYYPVLSIAGSDCSGGAGIQADIKAISALGGYAATAITAVTVQNTCGVSNIHPVPATIVKEQIQAVMEDIHPLAVKIGMVNDMEVIQAIVEMLERYRPAHVVFDPVMVSTSGHRLIEENAIELIKEKLIPLAELVTPNLKEAEVLAGTTIHNVDDMKDTARQLLYLGAPNVLVKGGHLDGDAMVDVLVAAASPGSPVLCKSSKIDSKNTHGTGCTLSSAIAALLAQGEAVPQAVADAKRYVTEAISHGKDVHIGGGHGPLNHFFAPCPMKIRV